MYLFCDISFSQLSYRITQSVNMIINYKVSFFHFQRVYINIYITYYMLVLLIISSAMRLRSVLSSLVSLLYCPLSLTLFSVQSSLRCSQLGLCVQRSPFTVNLRDVTANGGVVPYMDVIVSRLYPVRYRVTLPDGVSDGINELK